MEENTKDYEATILHLGIKALNSEEIQSSHTITDAFSNHIQEGLRKNSKHLLSSVSPGINKVEKLRKDIAQIDKKLTESPSFLKKVERFAKWLLHIFGSFFLLFIIASVTGKFVSIPWISKTTSYFPLWLISISGVCLASIWLILYFLIAKIIEGRREAFRKRLRQESRISEKENALKQAEDQLNEQLFYEIVFPFVRENIASLKERSYSTELGDIARSGLSEVHDIQYEVPTEARTWLERLLKEMRGGTIGISGPRGAGKTTILQSACKPDLPDTALDEKTIRVMVSAPIQYDARDFILHLFSEVCYAVFELLGGEKRPIGVREHPDQREIEWADRRFRRQFMWYRLILPNLALIGIILIMLGSYGFFHSIFRYSTSIQQVALIEFKAKNQPVEGDAVQGQVAEDKKESNSLSANAQKHLGSDEPTQLSKDSVSPSTFSYFIDIVIKNMGSLIRWGIYFLASALILSLARPWVFTALWRLVDRPRYDFQFKVPGIDYWSIPKQWRDVFEEAGKLLKDIHFQQSFSSGWKGSLSISLMGLDQTETETLAARQQTLPDIISNFRSFIEALPVSKTVIIAIDELDKMESPEKAEHFLNDIKSIFGIRNCIYLVSVSQSAMSRYERRGLPFRDTFDSCFDEIVQARYFDLEKTIRLLNRRVIGLPVPFQALCYCISGGLGRDLIRCCRRLFSLRDTLSAVKDPSQYIDLGTITKYMILDEINAKVDALHVAIKNFRTEHYVSKFVEKMRNLQNLRENGIAAESMLEAACNLWDFESALLVHPDETEAENLERKVLCGFSMEIGAYVYYLATVLELFDSPQDEKSFQAGGEIDQLAAARQSLEVNRSVSLQLITLFRKNSKRMFVPPWAEDHLVRGETP